MRLAFSILTLGVLGLTIGWSALTATPVIPSRSIDDERAALERATAQAKAAGRRSAVLESRATQATAQAERAKRDAAALASRIQESEAQIAAAEARIAIVETLQREQRARLAERQGPIVRLVAALQNLARRPTALTLVQPGSIDEMVRVRAVMATVIPRVENQTGVLRSDIARGKELRAQAERAARLLRESNTELTQRREALAKLETRRRLQSRQFADESRFEEERAIGLGEEARDIGDLMEKIRRSGSVRERLAALDGPILRPPRPEESQVVSNGREAIEKSRPTYRLPVVGEVITGLGEVSESGVRARGVTIATPSNAQIVAPADGRIAFAGNYQGYGQIVIIEHEGGWTSLITNLARLSTQIGDEVQQGDPIGNAERERPIVTVELRRNGRPIDIIALIG